MTESFERKSALLFDYWRVCQIWYGPSTARMSVSKALNLLHKIQNSKEASPRLRGAAAELTNEIVIQPKPRGAKIK